MFFSKVADFHRAFSLPIANHPSLPDQATRDLRIALLLEEKNEFLAADAADDMIEIADALADIAYILCGTAVTYGLVPNTPYNLPFANQTGMAPSFPNETYREVLVNDMEARFNLYLLAEHADDIEAIREALLRMLGQVAATAFAFGISLTAVFEEVHRSNMSKLGADGEVLRREDGKVMKGPHFRKPDIAHVLYAAE